MRPIRHRQRIRLAGSLALLALLGASACSVVRLAYDNAPRVLLYEMEGYVDLDGEQREQALVLLEVRMDRHRRVELPRYVELLGEAETLLADGATRAELELLDERIGALIREALAESIPTLVPLLASLDEAQIDALAARLEEMNAEFAARHAPHTLDERMQRRRERSVEMIERWTGRLHPAQVALIEKRRDAMPIMAEQWLAYHRANQRLLIASLRERASAQQITALLDAWWVRLDGPGPALAGRLAESHAAWIGLLVELDGTLDERQRAHVLARLESFREELSPLLVRAAAAPRDPPAAGEGAPPRTRAAIRASSAGA